MCKGTGLLTASSLGELCPLGIWGPGLSAGWPWGFIFLGKGRTWGGRGAGDRAGSRLSCGGDGLSRSLTAPWDLASQRTFPSPRDVSGHGYSSVPGPAVLGEAAGRREGRGRKTRAVQGVAKPVVQEYGVGYKAISPQRPLLKCSGQWSGRESKS